MAAVRDTVGAVDNRLYAAARPYALGGVTVAGRMLHRAANVLAAGGLILCDAKGVAPYYTRQIRTGPGDVVSRTGAAGDE